MTCNKMVLTYFEERLSQIELNCNNNRVRKLQLKIFDKQKYIRNNLLCVFSFKLNLII